MHRLKIIQFIVVLSLIYISTSVTVFAEDIGDDSVAQRFIQGYVSEDDGSRLVLNETWTIHITEETEFFNRRGKELKQLTLRGHKWIYVEGLLNPDGSIQAQKIYLIPGIVKIKDRRKYPFMQIP